MGGKWKGRQGGNKRLNNLVRIESGVGSLFSFFVAVGSVGQKGKHRCFPLWSEIYFDKILLAYLLIKSGKVVYVNIST